MIRSLGAMMSNSSSRPALEVNRKMLVSGVVLLCTGGVLWLTGAALSAAAVAQVAKKWIDHLDESPTEMAHRRAQQLKVAASAGSKAWREQSH
jgi:hypothetical protein